MTNNIQTAKQNKHQTPQGLMFQSLNQYPKLINYIVQRRQTKNDTVQWGIMLSIRVKLKR